MIADCFHKGGGKAGQWPNWYDGKRDDVPNNKESAHLTLANVEHSHTGRFERHVVFAAFSDGTEDLFGNDMSAFLDSGSTSHWFNSCGNFSDFQKITGVMVQAAKSGSLFQATGHGTVTKVLTYDGKETLVTLWNVLYCPELAVDLVSVSKLDDAGMHTEFGNGTVVLKTLDGTFSGLDVDTKIKISISSILMTLRCYQYQKSPWPHLSIMRLGTGELRILATMG